jgi:hypothetical protein
MDQLTWALGVQFDLSYVDITPEMIDWEMLLAACRWSGYSKRKYPPFTVVNRPFTRRDRGPDGGKSRRTADFALSRVSHWRNWGRRKAISDCSRRRSPAATRIGRSVAPASPRPARARPPPARA